MDAVRRRRLEVRVIPILHAFAPILLLVFHGVRVGETPGGSRGLVGVNQAILESRIGVVKAVQRNRVGKFVYADALATPAIRRPAQNALLGAQAGIAAEPACSG